MSHRRILSAAALALVALLMCCGSNRGSRAQDASDAESPSDAPREGRLVVLRSPTGEEEPQWAEPWRGLLLEREEATLWLTWQGERRLGWREDGRRLLLGTRVAAYLWQRLGAPEVLGELRRIPETSAAWLVLEAQTLTPQVMEALGRRRGLRLAVLCPVQHPCGLAGLARLAPILHALSLKDALLDDAEVRAVGRLSKLWSLSLRGVRLPAGFEVSLANLRNLRLLDLAGARSAGWEEALPLLLGRMPRLRWLDLSHQPLRPSPGLRSALQTLPGLRTLRLAATRVRDRDLAFLTRLRALRELDLSLTALGDPGAPTLGALTGLRALDLRDTEVSDQGVPHLACLTLLTLLRLPASLTDLGLGWLDRLQRLEGLSLPESAVTDRGHARLNDLPRLWWRSRTATTSTPARNPLPMRGSSFGLESTRCPRRACAPGGEGP